MSTSAFDIVDLGRMGYAAAYERQAAAHAEVMEDRERRPRPSRAGIVLTVEHDPVITVSRRATAGGNVLASAELLARRGVERVETDRGGDVTYHGPGQLVVYPILDLTLLNLGLHDYMRLLEQSVIDTCAEFGVAAERDPTATGVWVRDASGELAKVAAFGVRVRRWVSMHGLAINITTNMEHFGLIVPCGLLGRPVTSLQKLLGEECPAWEVVRRELVGNLSRLVGERLDAAAARRDEGEQEQ
ncbi:MAG: lipoyl(octanoyl) transferase LipB [Phycisphaerales bacterium]